MTTKARLWITRTEPAARRSAAAWAEAGYDPVIAPLLTIQPIINPDPVADETALIFTSGHAVRHCAIPPDGRPVFTVGDATARTARDYGFDNVISANGDWKSFLEVIENKTKNYLHICGTVVQGQLVETLRARGFDASRHIVYQSSPVEDWPVDVAELEAVALYSPLATATLMALPPKPLGHLNAYCLSDNVAAGLIGPKIHIADRPNEHALIACSHARES